MSVLPKPKKVRLRTVAVAASGHSRSSVRLRVRMEGDYANIDYDTRQFVWKRDGGTCCHCSAVEDLQFDHIIPRSRGGSGRAANVELLCGGCNNRKKTRLSTPSIGCDGDRR